MWEYYIISVNDGLDAAGLEEEKKLEGWLNKELSSYSLVVES